MSDAAVPTSAFKPNRVTKTSSATDAAWSGSKGFARDLQDLKQRDNVTNFHNIAVVYAVIAVTIGLTIWSYHLVAGAGLDWWWNIPATIVAVIAIGGSQHQFGGIIHEGTHYILFADKKLNEVASDWLAAFPIYTSTYSFRLHHLAHHQFVNDQERDPNFAQSHDGGYWLDFPLEHYELVLGVLKQLNPIRLARYILARAKYSVIGVETNPYADMSKKGSPWVTRTGALFAVGVPTVVPFLADAHMWAGAAAVIAVSLAVTFGYFACCPDDHFAQSRINPVVSHRATSLGRMTYLGIVYASLTAIQYETGAPAWSYFLLFWIVPLFTTFALFMVLREWLQHGNADRGRLTNTRVFFVNPISRYLIMPWGMDYHLPHHVFCSVPHYNLPRLHNLMRRDPDYADKGVEVENWVKDSGSGRPTIMDVLGPAYAIDSHENHVDDSTLEMADVNDAAAIETHKGMSRDGLKSSGEKLA